MPESRGRFRMKRPAFRPARPAMRPPSSANCTNCSKHGLAGSCHRKRTGAPGNASMFERRNSFNAHKLSGWNLNPEIGQESLAWNSLSTLKFRVATGNFKTIKWTPNKKKNQKFVRHRESLEVSRAAADARNSKLGSRFWALSNPKLGIQRMHSKFE